MSYPVGRPSNPEPTNDTPKLRYRASSATSRKLYDDVLSFFMDVNIHYEDGCLFYLAGFLTRDDICRVIKETHDDWLRKAYVEMQKSRLPAAYASVVTAVIFQYHEEDFVEFLSCRIQDFDDRFGSNVFPIFANSFYHLDFVMDKKVRTCIETKDVSGILDAISRETNPDSLLWYIQAEPLKDKSHPVQVAAFTRIREVAPKAFRDYCLDYKEAYIEKKSYMMLKKKHPKFIISARATAKPAGVCDGMWEMIFDFFDSLYNNPDDSSDLARSIRSEVSSYYKDIEEKQLKKFNRAEDILGGSVGIDDLSLSSAFRSRKKKRS